MIRRKVFVVGLDGGTFDLLNPWMEQGLLPHLQALVENGVSGELESTIPPMTAPAWTSFMTGRNPGKHAIYDFVTQEETGYRVRPLNARARQGSCLWDLIGEEGGRVVVLNVPMTYPPHPVNGAMVGDFMTPSGKKDFIYPPGLLEELEGKFGKYPLYPFPPSFAISQSVSDIEQFLGQYTEAMVYKFQVARYLLEKLDPHFLMLHIYGNDQICHWLWHLLDETHPRYRREVAERCLPKILEYYRRFDAEVGRLSGMRDEDTVLFIMSDHGFGPLHRIINLNVWLMREGYLVLRRRPITLLKYLLWRAGFTPEGLAEKRLIRLTLGRLIMRMLKDRNKATVDQLRLLHSGLETFLSLNDVDWSRTKAFGLFGWGQIKINVKGRYPQGCVSPGAEYQALRAEIVTKLRELKDPETGERVGGEVFTRDEVYWGPFLEEAPDITFLPMKKRYWANSRGTGFPSNRIFSTFLWGMTGMHTMNGILLAEGKPLRKALRVHGAHILDLFPTILYLMGIPVPKDTDGKVLDQIFHDAFLRENRFEPTDRADGGKGEALQGIEEQEEIIERLRELGYL